MADSNESNLLVLVTEERKKNRMTGEISNIMGDSLLS